MNGLKHTTWNAEQYAALRRLQVCEVGVLLPLSGVGVPLGMYALQLLDSQWHVWERVEDVWREYPAQLDTAQEAANYAVEMYAARVRGHPARAKRAVTIETQGANR